MPPKPKFTREEIVAAALELVSAKGMEALTSRYLGAQLGSSARPIFTVFRNMEEVQQAVRRECLPVIKSRCPADGVTTRQSTKGFVAEMSRKDPAFRQKTLHALQDSGIDGWKPLHTGRKKGWGKGV